MEVFANIQRAVFSGLSFALVLSSCAPPAEPEGLQKGSDAAHSEAAMEDKSTTRSLNFGGSTLGDSSIQADLKACVSKGFYFDRKASSCTSYALAKINCTDQGVKAELSPGILKVYEAKFATNGPEAGPLAGFVVDQCVSCPNADANPVCAGVSGNTSKVPGFVILLLKPISGSTSLESALQFIPK